MFKVQVILDFTWSELRSTDTASVRESIKRTYEDQIKFTLEAGW